MSSNPDEISFIAKCLAAQKKPVGIYFISEDIFTTASYDYQGLYVFNTSPTEEYKKAYLNGRLSHISEKTIACVIRKNSTVPLVHRQECCHGGSIRSTT
ncbi:MAG: hypothetical protein IJ608_13125 [Lachnospiraceae bacterium]|nr:hypothetical protein [Lachnospiraceae bacterium]